VARHQPIAFTEKKIFIDDIASSCKSAMLSLKRTYKAPAPSKTTESKDTDGTVGDHVTVLEDDAPPVLNLCRVQAEGCWPESQYYCTLMDAALASADPLVSTEMQAEYWHGMPIINSRSIALQVPRIPGHQKFCRCRKFEWRKASKWPAYVKGFKYRINGIKDAMQQSVKIFRNKNFDMVIWAGDPPAEHSCVAVFLSIATVLPDVIFVAGKRTNDSQNRMLLGDPPAEHSFAAVLLSIAHSLAKYIFWAGKKANDSQNKMLLCHSDWVALGGIWCGGENSVRELAILDTQGVATSTRAAWREQKKRAFHGTARIAGRDNPQNR